MKIKLLLLSATLLFLLAGCSDHTYHMFPHCNSSAQRHHSESVYQNRDAAIVAAQASADGWDNIEIKAPDYTWASVSGDCNK